MDASQMMDFQVVLLKTEQKRRRKRAEKEEKRREKRQKKQRKDAEKQFEEHTTAKLGLLVVTWVNYAVLQLSLIHI